VTDRSSAKTDSQRLALTLGSRHGFPRDVPNGCVATACAQHAGWGGATRCSVWP